MMPNQSNVRHRRKKDVENKTKGADSKTANSKKEQRIQATTSAETSDDEDLMQTFLKHPLVRVAPFVLIPYLIYNAAYFVWLGHPGIITQATMGLIKLRPAMESHDVRQVLILGAEVSENRFVTQGLSEPLRLEIVHEAYDAKNYFCRDGSVSWFQIMRFVEPLKQGSANGDGRSAQLKSWYELCVDRNHTLVELFHPKYFETNNCSKLTKWGPCWAQSCLSTLKDIWGCSWDDPNKCPQKFSRILHQVRHPLRTVEMLNASICPYPKLKTSFFSLVAGFFPGREWESLPCLEAVAWYTIDFHSTLIKARQAGLVHGMFHIEDTSPCQVVSLAGFFDAHTAVYEPNAKKMTETCLESDSNDAQSSDTFAKVRERNAVKIKELKTLTLDDVKEINLAEALKELISKLGYDGQGDLEFS